MILHRYFARKFFTIFLGILTVFFLLLSLIDLVEQVRRFASDGVSFSDLVGLTLLNAPQSLYDILPLVMILSTITLFLGLARSSELVVARATGRSAFTSLIAPVFVALTIGVVAVAVFNPLVAATSKRYETLYESYRNGGATVLSVSSEGLWLRQGDESGQTVIRAARANVDGSVLFDVTFISNSTDGGPFRRIQGDKATLVKDGWKIEGAKTWSLLPDQNPEASTTLTPTLFLPTTLTLDSIRDGFGKPSNISIWKLPDYIQQLETSGFSARRHTVWLQMELARPIFLLAMVLVASAFTMQHTRFGRTGISVLSAILLGFTLYYIRNFSQILGENGQIPITLAAWAPPVASILLALGILLHMEDG